MSEPTDKTKPSEGRGLIKQGSLYLLVGAGTALLELVLFQTLYGLGLLDIVWSNIIAVFIATGANFLLNGTVTFKTSSNMLRSLVLYLLLFAFNTCFSTFTISWLVSLGLHSIIAKVTTQLCIVCWNFVLFRKVVFV